MPTEKCPYCDKLFSQASTANMHIAAKHRDRIDAAVVGIPERDRTIAKLNEELKAAAHLAESPQVPASIADFPATEQAAYFTEFIKSLDDSERATLKESTGFELIPPASAATDVAAPPASTAGDVATPPASQGDEIAQLSDGSMAEFCVKSMRKKATGGDKEYVEMVILGSKVIAQSPLTELDRTGTGFYSNLFNKVQGLIEKGRLKEEIIEASPEPQTVLIIGNQRFLMKRREEPAALEEGDPKSVRIEVIDESLVNGQREQMVSQIRRYGAYNFFSNYREYLRDRYDLKTAYDHFTAAVLSYFRIKK
jgi:hypothetical protein